MTMETYSGRTLVQMKIHANQQRLEIERLSTALAKLIGYCEIAAVAPSAIGRHLTLKLDGPELSEARAALVPK